MCILCIFCLSPPPLSFCPSTPLPSPPPPSKGLAGTEGMYDKLYAPLSSRAVDVVTARYCVDWWNARRSESNTAAFVGSVNCDTLTGSSVQVTCGSLFKFRSKCRPPKKTKTKNKQNNNNNKRRQDIFIIIIFFCSFIHMFNCINLFVLIVV